RDQRASPRRVDLAGELRKQRLRTFVCDELGHARPSPRRNRIRRIRAEASATSTGRSGDAGGGRAAELGRRGWRPLLCRALALEDEAEQGGGGFFGGLHDRLECAALGGHVGAPPPQCPPHLVANPNGGPEHPTPAPGT